MNLFLKIRIIIFLLIILLVIGCDPILPLETKETLPSDHNVRLKTTFHKAGYEYPYGYNISTGEPNCAGARCHHQDLRGGAASIEDVDKVAPSCFQCHGKLWKEIDTVLTRN